MSDDLVIRGARILTQDPQQPTASWLHVHEGVIESVSDGPISVPGARVIDARGLTITPGFNDVHAHSVWFGLNQLELDVAPARSLDQLYDLIAQRALRLAPDEWLVATGLNPIALGEQYPDRDALDRAAGGRPVWLKHNSGHAAFVNGVALDRIAQGADLHAPITGGVVVRDAHGRPTGLLEENAMTLVQALVLPYPIETLVQALDLATQIYLAEGITSVTDAGIGGGWIGSSPREFLAYQEALDRGVLHTRMQPMLTLDALDGVRGHAQEPPALTATGGLRTGLGNDWLQLGPTKIFSDGSLLGTTAAMSEPYCAGHGPHAGYLQETAESLRERVLAAAGGGWSVAIHAIGDLAVDHAIDIIGEAQRRFGRRRIPHRIEHAGVVRDDQLPRIAALGIGVVPQPHFLREFGDGMAERVGPERADLLYRARAFLDHGIPLPGSSDRPVANGAALKGIEAYVLRQAESGAVIGAGERLTAEEAVAAYTRGSATVTGQAHRRGTLAPGMLADLVVLGDDPLSVAPDRISAIEVVATMVGGQLRYGADRLD